MRMGTLPGLHRKSTPPPHRLPPILTLQPPEYTDSPLKQTNGTTEPTTTFTTPQVPPPRPLSEYTLSTSSPSLVEPPNNVSSLQAQLVEARAQIAAMTKQLEGARSRPATGGGTMLGVAEQGVPVKIVAYLCLAAFLLAYLFF
jgi:hypothetical protein